MSQLKSFLKVKKNLILRRLKKKLSVRFMDDYREMNKVNEFTLQKNIEVMNRDVKGAYLKTKADKSLCENLFIRLPSGEIYELDK